MKFEISPEALERQALQSILAEARAFYTNPENVKAFEAWLQKNEEAESQ